MISSLRKAAPWLIAVAACLLACRFVVVRGQDQNWDLLSYHYFSGYAFVNGRFLEDVAPVKLQTYLNPLPNVLTFLAYSRLPFPFSSLALLGVQLLAVPVLVLLGREVARDSGRSEVSAGEVLALVLGLAAPMWWSELGTSFYSSTTAPLVLCGFWLLLRGATPGSSRLVALRQMSVAGALIGLATALRLTNAIFMIAGAFALVPVASRLGVRFASGRALAFLAGIGAGLAMMAWWYALVYREFGNPIFPLYNAVFRSPYFDAINLRDARWAFRTTGEFVRFLGDAAGGTSKTSEVEFADARLLACVAFAILALGVRAFASAKGGRRLGLASVMLLWFVGTGAVTWGLVFAYQRYLIPIELLLGLAVWALLGFVAETERQLAIGMATCVLLVLSLIRVPDWGHYQADARAASNIFGLELPEELARQPAEYLVAGAPDGFILAFLHPASHFYRIDFSPRVYGRIHERLARFRGRPVRLITLASASWALDDARRLGYEPAGECTRFRSHVDTYIACDMRSR